MADQLGLRQVLANTFKTVWVVPDGADRGLLDAYFRVLARADAELERDPAACLPLWRHSIPPEFADQPWDFLSFDLGERFVWQRLSEQEFAELVGQAERWGLDDYMHSKAFADLAYQPA
jgi:hypothetical protein